MLDVFGVAEVSQLSDDQWLVRGRAWEDLKMGDLVYSAVGRDFRYIHEDDTLYHVPIETDIPPIHHPFIVTALSTYGKKVEVLGAGWTGDLIVKGEHGATLKDTKVLVIL